MARVFENDKSLMKNIAIINTCNFGSTGKIGVSLLDNFRKRGYNAYFFYGRVRNNDTCENAFLFEGKVEAKLHVVLGKIFGLSDYFSPIATYRLISMLRQRDIDTIYMISPHGFYLNENIFYDYIVKDGIHLIYAMIDEYSYLGKCAYEPKCEKYKTCHGKCPDKKKYPASLTFDTCSLFLKRKARNYQRAKAPLFIGPQFLLDRSEHAYLRQFMNMKPIDLGIDLSMYCPRKTSDLREKLGIQQNQKVILFVGSRMKGSQAFTQMAQAFRDNDEYVFIHVGYREPTTDGLPSNYKPIPFVKDDSDVALYYSLADLLVYPSMADTMSNTCLEALACGTPILIFNISGMPYLIDETVGTIVPPGDVDALVEVVKQTPQKSQKLIETCRSYAEKRYDNILYIDKLIQYTLEDEKRFGR